MGRDYHILVLEDEPATCAMLATLMESEGFRVSTAQRAAQAHDLVSHHRFDLILLDLNLPDEDGLYIAREMRAKSDVGIIMLTSRKEDIDRVIGLEMGADDYVTKPFSPRELVARVKALLRRTEPPGEMPRVVEARGLMIDPSSYRVTHDNKPVTLSTLEFRLLYYLATRPNRVFTRDQLLDAVWGTERFVTPRSVDVYIRRLREKVETDAEHPAFLKTVRGAGYMFESAARSEHKE